MPETDIEVQSLQKTDSATVSTRQEVNAVADPVVPDTSFLVQEVAEPAPADTVAEFVPKRRVQQIDTCYIWAKDLPETAMDGGYLDSCLKEQTVATPQALLIPPHVPVSAEELAFDSIFAKLTNVADTTIYTGGHVYVSVKDTYKGFDATPLKESLEHQVWFTPYVFVLFFCYGLLLSLRSKSITRDSKDFFSHNTNRKSVSHPGEQKTQYRFTINFLAMQTVSLFALQAYQHLHPEFTARGYLLPLLGALGLTTLYVFFKQLCAAYMGFVFMGGEARHDWARAFWHLFGTLGLVLFPMVLCVTYGPRQLADFMVNAGFVAAALGEMLLVAYVVKRFFKDKFSILYLFLYLCTLEFLPLAALLLGYRYAIATI